MYGIVIIIIIIIIIMELSETIFTFSLVSFYAGELLRLFFNSFVNHLSTTFSSFIFTLSLHED